LAHAEPTTFWEACDVFLLDKHHAIERGKVFPICGNTWKMLKETRFARHFDFIGDFSRHYGIFAGCGRFGGDDSLPAPCRRRKMNASFVRNSERPCRSIISPASQYLKIR
jgi:hypothetical protein